MHKNHNSCLHIFGVVSLLLPCNFMFALKLEHVRDISMKLDILTEHNERMCHAQEP